MSRTQLYLVGLLLVQVVLILTLRSPFSGASAGYETRPLLPVLEAITPTRLEILGKDDESILLVRQDGVWKIEDLSGFPADGRKVDDMLGQLRDVRVRRPVVSSGRYHDAFKVAADENEARIRLWADGQDDPDVDLILGSSPNFRTSHVRLADEDEVYEASGLSPYDMRPTANTWIEREFVEADPTLVSSLILTNPSGSFELVRGAGGWRVVSPEGQAELTLDPDKVDSFVRSVTSLRLSDAAGPVDDAAHGFTEPAATLVLRLGQTAAGSEEITLRIGGQPEENESERYITREGFGFTGRIWTSSVSRLLEESLESLQSS